MGANFSTTKRSNGWAVKKEGSTRVSSVHSSQLDAWAETRRLARGVSGNAFLKDTEGRIRAQNSYKENAPRKKA
jgi:Uncharacterized protein conserved in bacteria (DUF2188)